MKKIRRRKQSMYKIKIDTEARNKLLELRNKHGFLDINYTIKYLLNHQEQINEEEILIENDTKAMSDEAIPIIVPKVNVPETNISTVNCPKCQHKFRANLLETIKCPKCGTEGKSS